MKRLVVITQVVDPDDPVLGATVAKIRALAGRFDDVVVLALRAAPSSLPAHCRVRTFGGGSRLGRALRLERALAVELARPTNAVLAHMAPIYAILAAPWCRVRHTPLLLWFAHWRPSRQLRLAERWCDAVVTVDRRSFPIASTKVTATGHGIDVSEFPCLPPVDHEGIEALSLGRYSPAKGIDTLVRAVSLVPGVRLTHHGTSATGEERAYRQELERLVADLGVGDRVCLAGPVPRREVVGLLARADVVVNNMRPGAPDKVVYEAAAGCRPVLASNPVLDTLLPAELRFPTDDAPALAEHLRRLPTLDHVRLGRELRDCVTRDHSVDVWADRVVACAASVSRARRPARIASASRPDSGRPR